MDARVNRRGAATREALIEAAMELWAATGWRGTGITVVAERAGVTPAGLLHHFGTKENFLLEVLAELDRRELTQYQSWGPPEGLEVIRRIPDMVRSSRQRPGLWKLQILLQAENLDPNGPAYEYYRMRHSYLERSFADALRRGQRRGEIRADADPELVAVQILAFLVGNEFHRHHGAEVDDVAAAEDFTDRLLRDLAVQRRPRRRATRPAG